MQIGATTTSNSPIISRYSGPDPITSTGTYTPPDINTALHKVEEVPLVDTISKGPRLLNTGMQFLSRLGRWGTGLIAGTGVIITTLSWFLFNAKVALVCALPTFAALAAFIGLKPKEDLHSTLQTENQDLLEKAASDAQDAKPEFILSRVNEIIKALQNARNNWGSVSLDKRPALLRTIENLKGKVMQIHDIYKDLAIRGKDGLAQMYQGCSLAKLEEILGLLNDTATDLGAHLARKTAKIPELGNN